MKTHSNHRFIAGLCLALAIPATMPGQTWQTSGTGDWHDPANWSGAGPDVTIGASGTAVLSSGNQSIGALNIATGGAIGGLIINGSGTLTETKNAIIGMNNLSQGSVYVNGSAYWQLTGNASNATIYVAGNADSTATGYMEIAGSGSVYARSVSLAFENRGNASMLITDNGKLTTIGGAHSFIGGNSAKPNTNGVVTISGNGYWENISTTSAGAILLGNAGTGALTIEGSGSLSSSNSASGGTALSIGHNAGANGSVVMRGNSALMVGAGKFNIGGSGTGVLTMEDNASVTAPRTTIATAGVGTLNLHGGVLTTEVVEHLSNNNSAINFNSGTLRAMTGANAFIISTNNKLTLNTTGAGAYIDSQDFVIATALSFTGDGGLTKLGTGEFGLTGAQGYTGVTTVAGGTLRLGADNAIATSSTVNVAASGVLHAADTQTLNNLTGAGAVKSAPSGAGNALLKLNSSADSVFAGSLDFDALEKTGSAKLALAKTNSIGSGANITITQGALALTGGTLSVTGTTSVASGATLGITSGAALLDTASLLLTNGAVLDVAGYTIVNSGSAKLVTTTNAITSSLADVSLSLDGQLFTAGVDKYYSVFLTLSDDAKALFVKSELFWNSAGLAHGTFNIADGETFAPPVSLVDRANGTFTALAGWDGKSLAKTGAGTLVLDTANTYTGTTGIASGTLRLAVADAIAASSAVNVSSGGVLNVATGSQTLNNLSGDGAITAAGLPLKLHSSSASTYAGAISAGALEKTGSGMLILSGTGAFGTIGTLDITQGGLSVTGGALDVSGAMTLANSATLGIAGGPAKITTATASFASGAVINILSGADGTDLLESTSAITTYGNITFLNNGVPITSVTLDTYSAYTPTLADSDKKIRLIASLVWNATGEAHGTFNIGSGVDFTPTIALADRAGGFTAFAGWDGKTLTKTGLGTLAFNIANTYSGTTTVSNGTLRLTAANAIASSTAVNLASGIIEAQGAQQTLQNLTGSGTLNNATATTLQSSADTTFAGRITGVGSIDKTGANTLTLAGGNDYTGGTTISAGKLVAANAAALGAGAVTNNAALEFAIATDGVFAALLTGSGSMTKTGAGALTATGSTFKTASVAITGGTLALGDVTHTVTGSAGVINVGSGAGLVMGADSTLAVGGTLALAANSSLGIVIGSGSGPIIGAGAVNIGSGVSLNLSGITGRTANPFYIIATDNGITSDFANITIGGAAGGIANYITISPGKTADGKGYKIDAFLTWTQTGTVRHGTFTLADAAESFTVGQVLSDKVANTVTGWDGKSLLKDGAGTLILSATNTYTGTTRINDGTLRLATANAIAASSAVNIAAGAVLETATGTQTLRNLTGSGTLRNSTYSILHSTSDTGFSGIVTGTGGIAKTGSATLTLSGANDYSGGTVITEGRLKTATLGALGSGEIINNAALELALDNDIAFTHALSGSGALIKTGTGTLTLATSNTAFNGSAIIESGKFLVTNAAALGESGITARDGTVLEFKGIKNAVSQNAIAGAGTFVVTSSTLTLAKGGEGIRNVDIANSTLTLADSKALGDGIARVTVGAASQLLFAANSVNLDTVALAANSTLGFSKPAVGSTPKTATIANLALTGNASLLLNVNLAGAASGVTPGGIVADYLRVTDSFSGNYSVTINPGSYRPTTYGVSVELISTPEPTAANAFTLNGAAPKITIGLIAYELLQGNGTELLPDRNSWYLADTGVSPAADVIFSAAAMMGADWHYSLDSLYLRLGDIRNINASGDAAERPKADGWMRARGYRLDAQSSLTGAEFHQYVYGVTLGIDKIFRLQNSSILLGALVDAGKLDRTFDNGATGHTRTISGGLYASWLHKAGWYADGVAKYDHNENSLDMRSLVGQPDETEYKNDVQGLSLELGRRVQGADGWWIELAAQGAFAWIGGAGYDTHPDHLTLRVEVEDATSVQYRGQIRLGRQFFSTRFHPYVKAGMANGETYGGKITAGVFRRKVDFDGWRAEAGGGFSWHVSERTQLYLDYEYARAESYDRPWSFNLGCRRAW